MNHKMKSKVANDFPWGGRMRSKVANDFPWGDTKWSNQTGSITLSHHDNRLGPNVVVEPAKKKKPRTAPNQTDKFVNQTGFLANIFTPQKAEEARTEELEKEIASAYPITGSCSVLTDNMARLEDEILDWQLAPEGKRSERRVKERHLYVLRGRLYDLNLQRNSACMGEEQERLRQQQMLQNMVPQQSGLTPTMFFIGVGILGFLIMNKK